MRQALVVFGVLGLLAAAALFGVGTSAVHEILATLTGLVGVLCLCTRAMVAAVDQARDALLAELQGQTEYQRQAVLAARTRQGSG